MSSLKIIGGEHKIDPDALNKRINRFEMPQLSLGRTCLYAILTSLQSEINCLLLPDYQCYSVVEVPLRINMPITHYHISSDFLPDFEDIRKKANENTGKLGILLISYFGMVDLNRSIQSIRQEYPDMIFLSFPGDEKNSGGCLAAGRGFFHINSHGGAEPCPASPYSDINVKDTSILEALNSNLFTSLRNGNILMDEHEGGCVLFEHKDDVERILLNNSDLKI